MSPVLRDGACPVQFFAVEEHAATYCPDGYVQLVWLGGKRAPRSSLKASTAARAAIAMPNKTPVKKEK